MAAVLDLRPGNLYNCAFPPPPPALTHLTQLMKGLMMGKSVKAGKKVHMCSTMEVDWEQPYRSDSVMYNVARQGYCRAEFQKAIATHWWSVSQTGSGHVTDRWIVTE